MIGAILSMKTCSNCHQNLDDSFTFCPSCGSKASEQGKPPPWPTSAANDALKGAPPSRRAKISFFLALSSIVLLFITAIPALILGRKELRAISAGRTSARGKRYAQVGFIMGTIIASLSLLASIYVIGQINETTFNESVDPPQLVPISNKEYTIVGRISDASGWPVIITVYGGVLGDDDGGFDKCIHFGDSFNIAIINPDPNATVGSSFYNGGKHCCYDRVTYGTNAFGAEVPIYWYGPCSDGDN